MISSESDAEAHRIKSGYLNREDWMKIGRATAALFIIGVHGVGLMKIFAWGMLNRHGIRRDLKRLELRVAELSEMLKSR